MPKVFWCALANETALNGLQELEEPVRVLQYCLENQVRFLRVSIELLMVRIENLLRFSQQEMKEPCLHLFIVDSEFTFDQIYWMY